VWVPKLENEQDFVNFSTVLGRERFSKFLVDLKTHAVYFVDAELYPMHKDFVFAELLKVPRTKEAERAFDHNYGKDKPSYLLGYLTYHEDIDQWTMSFWDGDKATAEHVRLAYQSLKKTFYAANKVKFRPHSNDQEAVARSLTDVPYTTNDAMAKASGFQVFNEGVAFGTLRIIAPRADYGSLTFAPDQIVILPEPLTDITPVAGIVSESMSSPLAHVNLRAKAWGIPNASVKDARAKFGQLEGKLVRLESKASGVTLVAATPAEASQATRARAPRSLQMPKANLDVTALASLNALRAKDAAAYGTKAANLGEVVASAPVEFAVPPGFAIPLAHYRQHLKQAGLDAKISAMLADKDFMAKPEVRKERLAELRKAIADAPMDPALAGRILANLKALGTRGAGANQAVFVRSSTNAEDLEGFSGAGLYDTVPNVPSANGNDVLAAVKRVWASVWNLAAFEERARYNIDQANAYGAVLVQVGIPATAAGVLITANTESAIPEDASKLQTFTINAKSGLGIRVVDGKKIPEIVLYNHVNKGLRVVSRSDEDIMLVFDPKGGVREVPNPNKGEPILTNARVEKLAVAARKLRALFASKVPLDIEWLLRGEDVFIVQVRPYVTGERR
jgi:hypothetical protein